MDDVGYEVSDGVAVLRLNAPERRNALTPAMAASLVAALDEADANPAVGAIVICGGSTFCAGAHLQTLSDVEADPASDENFLAIETIYGAFLRLGSASAPTIAAVRGAAVGAGVNLALAADLRIIANDARILSGFARIGLHPGGGHFAMLARAVGPEAAAAIGLFGVEIRGSQAVELGMAWRAVDDAEVEPLSLELAGRAAADPALARRMATAFRQETAQPALPWAAAVMVERAPQMWSFRRAHRATSETLPDPEDD